ncbi:hypothetical protein LJC26_06245, partial [Desulfovibrio sp. OttesenSCG-928-O18]|nr:hypothetical protein [Desulfovibrio sp. OttesenSCG-928-O18]
YRPEDSGSYMVAGPVIAPEHTSLSTQENHASGKGSGGGEGGGWENLPESPGVTNSFADGAQNGVGALAWRMREPDFLTPEQRENMDSLDKLAYSLGQILTDTPAYAAGGIPGAVVGGPVGGMIGAFGAQATLRVYYIDAIRNGRIKNFDDVLRRMEAMGWGALEGAAMGAGTASGMGIGQALSRALGLGISGKMAAGAAGEVLGLTGTAALFNGQLPTLEDFQHNAALIVGLRGMSKATGGGKEAMGRALQNFWADSGVRPEVVGQIAKSDPAVAAYLQNPKLPMPETLAAEVQRAVIYNDSRSVKMTFKETGVEPSVTNRPELHEYLHSLKGEDMAALKMKDPTQYLTTLKSIVRKVFPKGGNLKFRSRDGKFDYDHLVTDKLRSMFIHTLPRTLKDYDIKVEFTTKEDAAKAYLIKKYFDPIVQKDMWDMLVFHNAELTTKIARPSATGRRSVESSITKAGNK